MDDSSDEDSLPPPLVAAEGAKQFESFLEVSWCLNLYLSRVDEMEPQAVRHEREVRRLHEELARAQRRLDLLCKTSQGN